MITIWITVIKVAEFQCNDCSKSPLQGNESICNDVLVGSCCTEGLVCGFSSE